MQWWDDRVNKTLVEIGRWIKARKWVIGITERQKAERIGRTVVE